MRAPGSVIVQRIQGLLPAVPGASSNNDRGFKGIINDKSENGDDIENTSFLTKQWRRLLKRGNHLSNLDRKRSARILCSITDDDVTPRWGERDRPATNRSTI
jgi:hypothetical protein